MVVLLIWGLLSGGLIVNQSHYETCKSVNFEADKCEFQKKMNRYEK